MATALKAGRLILVTDVDGVKDKEDNLISSLNAHAANGLIDGAS